MSSASKPRTGSSKKKKTSTAVELDEEGVPVSGGVGKMQVEKKATAKKKRKAKADEEEDDDSSGDEHKSKKKGGRGASSVDTSKGHLSAQEQLHEEYMQLRVPDLTRILNVNLIALPKQKNKDGLAWQCVYGQVLGAPPSLCTRCGQGKLKPKLKPNEFGMTEVKKGVTKWTCPGYFDADADAFAWCNKAFTDEELKPVPFKGKGHISEEDIEAAEARRKAAAEEREAAKERRIEAGLDSDVSLDEHGKPKRKFVHAARLADQPPKKKQRRDSEEEGEGEGQDDAASSPDEKVDGEGPMHAFVSDPAFASDFVSDAAAAAPAPAAAAAAATAASVSSPRPTPAKKDSQRAAAAEVKSESKNRGSSTPPPASGDKPQCKYGASCYRTSAEHLAQFAHPK